MNDMPTISVIVPAYNEGAVLSEAAVRIEDSMQQTGCFYEIIFIDDGSTDDTWTQIMAIAESNPCVAGIKLSKNFGKEGAILAGLSSASGDAVVLIDCDLQHPPSVISEMCRIWLQGNVDIVEGIKETRGNESKVYKFFANLFYRIIGLFGGVQLKHSSDFQFLDRRIVNIIIKLPERQRFFRALSSWIGFNKKKVTFCVEPRRGGQSKWNFYKSAKYALTNITSFSTAPMQIVTLFGFVFFGASIVLGIHTIYAYVNHKAVEGFTTVILLLLIIGAMLMISLGVLGLYIAKIYEEIKGRPQFLIENSINLKTKGVTKQ